MATIAELQAQIATLTQTVTLLQTQFAQFQQDYEDAGLTPGAEIPAAIDNTWLLLCAMIIFTMQAGFGLLEAGAVRSRNSKNVMLKACFDACAGALGWWATGYAFAGPYALQAELAGSNSMNPFIGTTYFFSSQNFSSPAMWFFQFTFAATSSTIINGAMSERTSMGAYLCYTSFSTGFMYPVIAHWVWSAPGWLSGKVGGLYGDPIGGSNGLLDFAGAGVVHLTGGSAAIVGAIIVGPRIGRFTPEGEVVEIPGHSAVLQGLGAILLWFGFYAFNCGSTLTMVNGLGYIAANVALNTTIAAASGGLTALIVQKVRIGYFDLNGLCNGFLTGAVAITSPAGFVEPWAACIIGVWGACTYLTFAFLVAKARIDDPIDAFSVHAGGGLTGLWLCGWFAKPKYITQITGWAKPNACGFVYGCGGLQLGIQVLGAVCIMAWAMGISTLLFSFIKFCPGLGLRVSADVEMAGMDVSKHGGSAYPEFSQKADVWGAMPGPDIRLEADGIKE